MITVLTPTYNRAYILKNAYDSLCKQTNFSFEWLIVDDGSTDNTEELVQTWMQEHPPFTIQYFKRENGGKHRAVNFGTKQANYPYILILDSDDILTDDAIETIHRWLETIEGDDSFAGVAGLRGWINCPGSIGGAEENDEYTDAKNTERLRLGLTGDKAEIYRKDIMLRFPFPEFEGEKFLQESAAWDRIALAGYKLRWFNRIIYKGNYIEDGLTRNLNAEVFAKNFLGYTDVIRLQIIAQPYLIGCLKIGQYAQVARKKQLADRNICKLLSISYKRLWLGQSVYHLNQMKKTKGKK